MDRANLTAVAGVVDEQLALASSPGFVRYEAGDAWAALHILAPQVEHAVRILGISVGARVTSYTAHEGTRWVSMTTLLAARPVREALGEDLTRNVEALFVEPYGQNFRNNVAHGAFTYPGNARNAATVCIFTLLTLCAVILQQRSARATAEAPGSSPHPGAEPTAETGEAEGSA